MAARPRGSSLPERWRRVLRLSLSGGGVCFVFLSGGRGDRRSSISSPSPAASASEETSRRSAGQRAAMVAPSDRGEGRSRSSSPSPAASASEVTSTGGGVVRRHGGALARGRVEGARRGALLPVRRRTAGQASHRWRSRSRRCGHAGRPVPPGRPREASRAALRG